MRYSNRNMKSHECCAMFCRDWHESMGGRLPTSDHSPMCKNYNLEEFSRISLDGVSFVCEPRDVADFMKDADDDISQYKIEKVLMTRDQFKKLDDFAGF